MGTFALPSFRNAKPTRRSRRPRFETLESRELLSLTITDNGNPFPTSVTIDAGAPLMLALTGAGNANLSFTASSSSPGKLAASVMPSTNRTVQIAAHTTTDAAGDTTPQNGLVSQSGVMDFMLMDNYVPSATNYFANLVTSDFYNSAPNDPNAPGGKQIIFRDDSDVLQMGSTNNTNSGGAASTSIDDAYNPNLVYTSDDVLAMAKPGNDENNSQFFITNAVERKWDFRYTILGVMTEGDAFRQTIAALPTTENTSTDLLQPNDPVVIDSVSLITDTQDGVLELSAPTSSIGKTFTVNVVIGDGNPADSVQYPLAVSVVQDPTPPLPYLLPIPDVHVVSGGAASLNLSAYVPPGDVVAGDTAHFAYANNVPGDGSCRFSAFSSATGQTTITAAYNFAGQTEVLVGVDGSQDSTGNYDSQYVPVFVTPTAPSVILAMTTVPGTSAVTIDQGLTFDIAGVFPGAEVELLADGKLVGSATANPLAAYPTSVTITTNSGVTLSEGQHVFTATQEVLGKVTNVPNRSDAYHSGQRQVRRPWT